MNSIEEIFFEASKQGFGPLNSEYPTIIYISLVIIPVITFMFSARSSTIMDIYRRVTDLNWTNPVPFAVIWYKFIFRVFLLAITFYLYGMIMMLMGWVASLVMFITLGFKILVYMMYFFITVILFYIVFFLNYNSGAISLISPIIYYAHHSKLLPGEYNIFDPNAYENNRVIITIIIFLFLLFINFNYFKTKAIVKSIIRNCYILIMDKIFHLIFLPNKCFKFSYFGRIESVVLWLQIFLISNIIYDKIEYKHAYSIMHNILEFCSFDNILQIISTPSIFVIYAIPTIIKYYLKTIIVYETIADGTNKYGFGEAISMGWKNALENADGSVVKALFFPRPFKNDKDKFSMLD